LYVEPHRCSKADFLHKLNLRIWFGQAVKPSYDFVKLSSAATALAVNQFLELDDRMFGNNDDAAVLIDDAIALSGRAKAVTFAVETGV